MAARSQTWRLVRIADGVVFEVTVDGDYDAWEMRIPDNVSIREDDELSAWAEALQPDAVPPAPAGWVLAGAS